MQLCMHILSIIMWCFVAITASNQRVICSCMIFYSSWFIIIFIMNFVFSMNFVMMKLPRYHDVTYFLNDPNEICSAYVKLEIKDILFMRMF